MIALESHSDRLQGSGMTDWQKLYESGETPWNKGGASPPLMQWLESHRLSGRVLVPGCGHGHDLVALAESGAAEVIGLDIAPGAVEAARERTAGLPSVQVVHGDLFRWCEEEGRGAFDAVFEHTCFCAIPPEMRDAYERAIASALKPGGIYLAVFYLEPWAEAEDRNQGPPFRSEVAELDRRFSQNFELIESFVPGVSYPGREGRELLRVYRRR